MNRLSFAILFFLATIATACSPKAENSVVEEQGYAQEITVEEEVASGYGSEEDLSSIVSRPVYETSFNDDVVRIQEELNTLGPVSVQQTIDKTLEHHRGIKILLANREAAQYEVKKRKAGWGPSLDLTGDIGYGYMDSSYADSSSEGRKWRPGGAASIVATQPLWDGYNTRSQVRAGNATVDSITARILDNATTFALDAIIAHADVIRRREMIKLTEKSISNYKRTLGAQRVSVEAGIRPISDISVAQFNIMTQRNRLSEYTQLLKEAEAQYFRLTGEYPSANLEPIIFPEKFHDNPKNAYIQAGRTNPKLVAYLNDINVAKHEKDTAKANYSPQIDLQLGATYSYQDPGDIYVSEQKSLDATVQFSWNLFNSMYDLNSVRSANASVVEARQYVMNFMDELKEEIDGTYAQYYAAKEQQKFYEQAKGYSRQTYLGYLQQYEVGTIQLEDIAEVEAQYITTEIEELTAKNNVLIGAYRVLALTGELVNELGIDEDAYNAFNVEEAEAELAF